MPEAELTRIHDQTSAKAQVSIWEKRLGGDNVYCCRLLVASCWSFSADDLFVNVFGKGGKNS